MILECKNLVIGYENRVVLKGINFEINDGEYVCLFGDNGSGKSTLVKTILGLNSKLKGEINFAKDVSQRSIGYLPQHNDNLTDFPASVYEVVRSGCLNRIGFRPFYNKNEVKRTRNMLKVLEIENLENRSFSELSGGQQQRVLLARALCATDKVLILDEPFNGVENETVKKLRKVLLDEKEKGKIIILASHIKDDIEELVLIGRSNNFLYPCGACRQVICELMNLDAKITLFRLDKKYKEIKVKDLMPFIFDESELNAK